MKSNRVQRSNRHSRTKRVQRSNRRSRTKRVQRSNRRSRTRRVQRSNRRSRTRRVQRSNRHMRGGMERQCSIDSDEMRLIQALQESEKMEKQQKEDEMLGQALKNSLKLSPIKKGCQKNSMTEDEILAQALKNSLKLSPKKKKCQKKNSMTEDEQLALAIANSMKGTKSPKNKGCQKKNSMTEDEMLALAFANSLELSPKFNALQQGDIYTNPCREGHPWDNQPFKFIQIPGDGHCGYYSVLGGVNPDVYLQGDQYIQPSLHEIRGLRKYIANKIPEEKLEIAAAADECSPSEYKRRVKKDKYMDQIELEQLADHFEVPIVVHDTGSGRTLVHGKRFLRIKPPIHLHYDSPDEERNLAHYSLLLPQ